VYYKYLKKLSPGHYTFSSESVSPGHPDKLCDQIADRLLDEFIANDPHAKVAIEVMASNSNIILSGETASYHHLSSTQIDFIVRECLDRIGYNRENGFSCKNIGIINFLQRQSSEITACVESNSRKKIGAGDQGIMFGYACQETSALMPAAIYYANSIVRLVSNSILKGELPQLGPDAKTQVTLEYDHGGKPIGAKLIVLSIQHPKKMMQPELKKLLFPIIEAALPIGWMCTEENLLINPSGKFTIGGPESDTGLTGRKIIVDTYGGAAPHGGGAFSGKDPTKVDRSAAYMARHLAKNIVAAGVANKCTIQLGYAIGLPEPISFYINTHGTGIETDDIITENITDIVDLTPGGICNYLKLRQPIYTPTATFGHFGRNPRVDGSFSWEKIDLVEILKRKFSLHD
jgi:S-adenosylmethionine synthetase